MICSAHFIELDGNSGSPQFFLCTLTHVYWFCLLGVDELHMFHTVGKNVLPSARYGKREGLIHYFSQDKFRPPVP